MAARTVQINSFCGGSSKLVDSEFLGLEESVNMYPETVTATDSYTTKLLKSVEGFDRTKGYYEEGSWIVGVLNVNTNPFNNASIKEAKGNVLFVDDDKSYTLSLKPQVRFVDASEYTVKGKDSFYGFLAGILAGNYDISVIYVDAFLKLVKAEAAELEGFFAKLRLKTSMVNPLLHNDSDPR